MITTRIALVLMLVWVSPTDAAAEEPQRLAEGVYLFSGQAQPGIQPDGNSVLLKGAGGWIVFDTGRHAAHTNRLISFARASGHPIVVVINSHWHLDHAAGNRRILDAFPGVKVHASNAVDEALEGFLANYAAQLGDYIPKVKDVVEKARLEAELASIKDEQALRPHMIISGCSEHEIGGRRLHLCVEQNAVTAADIWLQDIESGVLAAGDLVTLPAPFMDTACLDGWRNSLAHLVQQSFSQFVPGHGRAMTTAELQQYSTSFDELLECAKTDAPASDCKQQWLNNVDELMSPNDVKYTQDLLDYYLTTTLRGNEEKQNERCTAAE